jgi:hypothetical protein
MTTPAVQKLYIKVCGKGWDEHPVLAGTVSQSQSETQKGPWRMNKRIKQYLWWAVVGVAVHFLMSHHIIYTNHSFKLLDKPELTLEYTFFSLDNKRPETVLKNDVLRRDGIGDILVELGRITEDEKTALVEKYDYVSKP